ncbi:MAG: glycoside hydrolase family 3 protein [Erysipelotrichaceae bacterium]|nr:glycoside hydrolase family 3 protein [Erysipelotrichaceae bacterium]
MKKHSFLISIMIILSLVIGCSSQAKGDEKQAEEEIVVIPRAEEILNEMTLEEKVSQMILIGVTASTKAKSIKSWQPGGIVLFADSFQESTKSKMKSRLEKMQKKSKIKMLISIDEEGGTVTRMSRFRQFRKSKYLSPRDLYNKGGYERIEKDTKSKDKLLKSLGINTNIAPVADTPYKRSNFIYDRAMSTSAKKNAKYVRTVVQQMNEDHMVSVVKHFPGYGKARDTHTSVVKDKRKLSTFESRDLLPFASGIDKGCSMIMVCHNKVSAFDKKNPASVSSRVMSYLRETMNYEGVIVTDSVSMVGVKKFAGSSPKAAVKAVSAGADMVCADNGFKGIKKALVKAAKDGTISEAQIDASVLRILNLKLDKGIIE